MNINLTQLAPYFTIGWWVLGVILGTVIANLLAKQKVMHVTRSTIIGFLLSLGQPLNLIHILLLIRKPTIAKSNETL